MNSSTTPTNWTQRRVRVESGKHKGKEGTWHAKDGRGNHFVRIEVKGEPTIVAVRRHSRLEDVVESDPQQTADELTAAAHKVAGQLVREGVDPDEACRAAGIAAAEATGRYRIGQRLLVDGRTPCTVVIDFGGTQVKVRYYPSLDTEHVDRARLWKREQG